jgi:hypothetical protein
MSDSHARTLAFVMAALVPAIHVFTQLQEGRGCPHSRA